MQYIQNANDILVDCRPYNYGKKIIAEVRQYWPIIKTLCQYKAHVCVLPGVKEVEKKTRFELVIN